MVTTVTLNPCIDRTIEVEGFIYGGTNKVTGIRSDISGKGINVSVVLQNMGINSCSIGFDYAADSRRFCAFLDDSNIESHMVAVNGSLRVNTKIFDTATGIMSEFNDKGGIVARKDVDNIFEVLRKQLDYSELLVLGGSVPPGVPSDIYEKIIYMAHKKNVKTILDASGKLLLNGINAKPYLIKPNEEELGETFHVKTDQLENMIDIADRLVKTGIHYVCNQEAVRGLFL